MKSSSSYPPWTRDSSRSAGPAAWARRASRCRRSPRPRTLTLMASGGCHSRHCAIRASYCHPSRSRSAFRSRPAAGWRRLWSTSSQPARPSCSSTTSSTSSPLRRPRSRNFEMRAGPRWWSQAESGSSSRASMCTRSHRWRHRKLSSFSARGPPRSRSTRVSRLDRGALLTARQPPARRRARGRPGGSSRPGRDPSRLGDRLDRLKGGRDADPRQQTLRATIAWSHDLLDQPERELFAALAVFAGGATIDAVEAVCNADLDVLTSLLDKSLVRRTGERVWMLETIREFASERSPPIQPRTSSETATPVTTSRSRSHGIASCAAPARRRRSSGSRPSATTCARPRSACSIAIRPRPFGW